MIDVIAPVLARPQNAQPLADSFEAHAPHGATLTFVVTPGDKEQEQACYVTGHNVIMAEWLAGYGDYARKICWGYRMTDSNPYILNASDDISFQPGWANEALKKMVGTVGVVATNDQSNAQVKRGDFGTHCLISRDYITEYGGTGDSIPDVVLWDGYDHNFVDRELCGVARHRHQYAFAKTSVIRHSHPLWKTAQWDPTYRKSLARFTQDRELFLSRAHLWGQAGLSSSERTISRRRDIVRR